ncbi:MAG: hypothetical protein H0U40_01165, partial [Chloroflexia bacterium]|nr:hypothetical protein [Chloroflexia bacterium]
PEEILVSLTKREGYAAAQGAIGTVVLDTSLTPSLIREGQMRDFVRGVQDARKRAGYEIEHRIILAAVADPEIVTALTRHEATIRAEVLAVALDITSASGRSDAVEAESTDGPGGTTDPAGWYRDQIQVGQHHVDIAIRRAIGGPE